jgi:hypothetical protein
VDGAYQRGELGGHAAVHLDDPNGAVVIDEELDVEDAVVEAERRHQPLGHAGHRLAVAVGHGAWVLEAQEADRVRVHDRVGDADRCHPAPAHEALECDQVPRQQLLGDHAPERTVLQAAVKRGDGIQLRPGLCQRVAQFVLVVHRICQLRQVPGHRLHEEGERQRLLARPVVAVGVDLGEPRRRLWHGLLLEAPALQLVVAAHERLAAAAGKAQTLGQDAGDVRGRVVRPERAVADRPLGRHLVDETGSVEPRGHRRAEQPQVEPLQDPFVGEV